jgi:hypothetical protein
MSGPSSTQTAALHTQRSNGLWEWLWRSSAVRSTRARSDERKRAQWKRAQLAAEFADRALAGKDTLTAGSSLPLALSLYREAAHWATLAQLDGAAPAPLREAQRRGPLADPSASGLSTDELATARAALADKTFVETADDAPEVQRREALLAQKYVRALVEEGAAVHDVTPLLVQRFVRSALALLALTLVLVLVGIGSVQLYRGPDLARGRAWRTSSVSSVCHPERKECGGVETEILFHTLFEQSPWFEIDLGALQQVSRIRVWNRSDCCQDRAVPLLAEVSTDGKLFQQVGKRIDQFDKWEARFAPVQARYVRLRVQTHSALHLLRVEVYAR